MTALSVDIYEKFKAQHGFDLSDLEHVCGVLSDCDRQLCRALRDEEKAGREISGDLSYKIAWVTQELEQVAYELKLTVTELRREAIR